MPSVYKGKEPYIFVSYSRRDHAVVYPLIEVMQKQGYRVWFDTGLEAGSNYSDIIAEKIDSCHAFLFMTSKNSIESEYCLDEIMYARDTGKPAWKVYLEENVELPRGIKMRTGRFQDILYWKNPAETEFMRVIQEATVLNVCRDVNKQPSADRNGTKNNPQSNGIPPQVWKMATENFPKDRLDNWRQIREAMIAEEDERIKNYEKRQAQSRNIGKVSMLWGLSEVILCFAVLPILIPRLFSWFDNWGTGFLLMIVLRGLWTLGNTIVCKKLTPEDPAEMFWMIPLLIQAISILIGVFVTALSIPWEMTGFVKFLVSVCINVLPAFASAIIFMLGHEKMISTTEFDLDAKKEVATDLVYWTGELLVCFFVLAVYKDIFHYSDNWLKIFLWMLVPHSVVAVIVSVVCLVLRRMPFSPENGGNRALFTMLAISMILSVVVLIVDIPSYASWGYPIWAVAIAINIAPTVVAWCIYKGGLYIADHIL